MGTIPSEFEAALSRLDAEIARSEAGLADLRLKRKGAQAVLAYTSSSGTTARPAKSKTARPAKTRTASVVEGGPADFVLKAVPINTEFGVNDVHRQIAANGVELTREQV